MSGKIVSRLLFRLLPVQILMAAIGSINSIVSSLFASNSVGVDAMSAVGLYNPVSQLITAAGALLVSGASILCGKYMGRNEKDKVQKIYSLSITMGLVLGAVFTLILFFIGIFDLSGFLTTDPVIRPLLNQYLTGQSIGIIPFVLGGLFSAFLSLENKTKEITISSIVYIIVNVALTYLFVVVLHMEALGLALASSIGLWVHFIMEVMHFLHGSYKLHFTLKNIVREDVRDIVRIGFPGAASNGYQFIRGLIVNMLIVQYVGSVGLSAFTAANTLLNLAWAIPTGMLCVSRMLISISIGEEDRQNLIDTIRNTIYRFIPLMCIISAAIIAFAVPLTSLYYQDTSAPVFNMTVWGFRLLPVCMPLAIFRMVLSCYNQTMDRNIQVNLLEAVDGFVTVCLFSFILVPVIGINGVYIANIINGIVSMLYLFGYSILKNRRYPKNVDELIVIPDGFGAPETDRIDISLHSIDEVINISQDIQQFCLDRGIDERRSYFAALFMEEMAGNVVLHGFNKDSRPHSVDIRVVYKDASVILRIRDDCVPFDPEERQKIFDPEDITKNIGIRMVYKMADDITYNNILGLNVLTIRM